MALDHLPSPGGTCRATQLTFGEPTWGPGYGAAGTMSVYFTFVVANIGSDCELQLPSIVGVAAAGGPLLPVEMTASGTMTASGDNTPSMTYALAAGTLVSIVIGASWWVGVTAEGASPWPSPRCNDPVDLVTRIDYPVGIGVLRMDLPTVVKRVCTSPASLWTSFRLG